MEFLNFLFSWKPWHVQYRHLFCELNYLWIQYFCNCWWDNMCLYCSTVYMYHRTLHGKLYPKCHSKITQQICIPQRSCLMPMYKITPSAISKCSVPSVEDCTNCRWTAWHPQCTPQIHCGKVKSYWDCIYQMYTVPMWFYYYSRTLVKDHLDIETTLL